jgi:hypothetical protein
LDGFDNAILTEEEKFDVHRPWMRRMPVFWYSVRRVRLKFKQRCEERKFDEGGYGVGMTGPSIQSIVNIVRIQGAGFLSHSNPEIAPS